MCQVMYHKCRTYTSVAGRTEGLGTGCTANHCDKTLTESQSLQIQNLKTESQSLETESQWACTAQHGRFSMEYTGDCNLQQ